MSYFNSAGSRFWLGQRNERSFKEPIHIFHSILRMFSYWKFSCALKHTEYRQQQHAKQMLLSRGISKPLIKSLIHLHIFYRLTSITRFVFTQFYLHCHILLWYIYEQYIETISYHLFNVLINIHLPILYRLVYMFLGLYC